MGCATGTNEGGECTTGADAEGVTTGKALGNSRPTPRLGRSSDRSVLGYRLTGSDTLELILLVGLLINKRKGLNYTQSLHPLSGHQMSDCEGAFIHVSNRHRDEQENERTSQRSRTRGRTPRDTNLFHEQANGIEVDPTSYQTLHVMGKNKTAKVGRNKTTKDKRAIGITATLPPSVATTEHNIRNANNTVLTQP